MAVTVTGSNGADNINDGYPGWDDNQAMLIDGLKGNDTIEGGFETDTIFGGGGDDVITAYMGEVHGGTGDDHFIVDEYSYDDITFFETAGEGYDWLDFNIFDFRIGSYVLADNIEKLSGFFAHAGQTITGNADDNDISGFFNFGAAGTIEGLDGDDFLHSSVNRAIILDGGEGNDTLNGDSDNDTLIGGGGNDLMYVDRAREVVVEGLDQGFDRVISSVNYTLSENVEKLTLTGTALKGIGNGVDNVLEGNGLDNILNGAGGADTMKGGDGSDVYVVNDAGDKTPDEGASGVDEVRSSVTYTAFNSIEILRLVGGGDISGRTGNGANTLYGNTGANGLRGEAGADTLIGGGGNDTLNGGAGADEFRFDQGGFGVDRIADFEDGNDVIAFDSAVFADFNEVMANATENANGVRLDAGADGSILIVGATLAQLDESDFSFLV